MRRVKVSGGFLDGGGTRVARQISRLGKCNRARRGNLARCHVRTSHFYDRLGSASVLRLHGFDPVFSPTADTLSHSERCIYYLHNGYTRLRVLLVSSRALDHSGNHSSAVQRYDSLVVLIGLLSGLVCVYLVVLPYYLMQHVSAVTLHSHIYQQ